MFEPGGPPLERLKDTRLTTYSMVDDPTKTIHEREDVWNSNDQSQNELDLGSPWTGSTLFYEYTDEDEMIIPVPTDMALVPKSTLAPLQPTPNERMLHNLTHLPYRSWCEVCLRSKAKTDQHRTIKLREPLIKIDHTFLTDTNKQSLIILTGIDALTGL